MSPLHTGRSSCSAEPGFPQTCLLWLWWPVLTLQNELRIGIVELRAYFPRGPSRSISQNCGGTRSCLFAPQDKINGETIGSEVTKEPGLAASPVRYHQRRAQS